MGFLFTLLNSYRRSKWGNNRNVRERRTNVLDSNSLYRQQNRIKDPYAHLNLSKEQRRELFTARVLQEEEDMKQRRMQDDMILMHQHRCSALGLDPSVTPVVDISGHYYLDSATIQWKRIVANGITRKLHKPFLYFIESL
jgi:hypothetical protein